MIDVLLDLASAPAASAKAGGGGMMMLLMVLFFLVIPLAIILPIVLRRRRNASQHYDAVVALGNSISYSGIVHGSVGIDYKLIYPTDAFSEKVFYTYTHPEKAEMPGGDERSVVYSLQAIRKGTFVIEEMSLFRGEIKNNVNHIIKIV